MASKVFATGPEIPVELIGDQPEWWVKIVEFLNQNWALPVFEGDDVTLLFVGDTSGANGGVFDRLSFPSLEEARRALARNGFEQFAEDRRLQKLLSPPELPLREGSHWNGNIYSSGRFWRMNEEE